MYAYEQVPVGARRECYRNVRSSVSGLKVVWEYERRAIEAVSGIWSSLPMGQIGECVQGTDLTYRRKSDFSMEPSTLLVSL